MHGRTEDLLNRRDGEPLDAEERAAIDASPALRLEIERLRRVQRALLELPEVGPPPGVWERVVAASDVPRREPRLWAGIAAAAAITAVAVGYFAAQRERPVVPRDAVVLARSIDGQRVPYVMLLAESAALEQLLAEMPRRPVMAGSTAATIAGLEDRIAFIDGQLAYASTFQLQQPQREALWSERVDLMSALVHVRYASAQQ